MCYLCPQRMEVVYRVNSYKVSERNYRQKITARN